MLPKTVKFSCQITVLHQRKLGWKNDGEARKGFDSFPYSIKHSEQYRSAGNTPSAPPAPVSSDPNSENVGGLGSTIRSLESEIESNDKRLAQSRQAERNAKILTRIQAMRRNG